MGTLVDIAIKEAGFSGIAQRALEGTLTSDDHAQLAKADTLVLSAIADRVRAKFHADVVQLVATRGVLPGDVDAVVATAVQRVEVTGDESPTGEEVLRSIALARLKTPGTRAIAVSWDHIGLQLAQTALLFGANVLFGGIGQKGVLPLADNPGIRRQEITGLVQRALREPQWFETAQAQLESRS